MISEQKPFELPHAKENNGIAFDYTKLSQHNQDKDL